MKLTKRSWHALGGLLLLGILLILWCNLKVTRSTAHRLYDEVAATPHRHAALLLGTSPTLPDGRINLYFRYRIDACARLYAAGKMDRIIISGDNHVVTYNEPEAMRDSLVARGIPSEVIFLDYAGFRTLDSVVRAKEIFGQRSLLIVSQRFHNERAVFLAGRKGIDAIGFNAQTPSTHFKVRFREVFARVKVFLDLLLAKQPHFLGDPIDIG